VPIVTVEPLGGGRVRLSQRRFLTLGAAEASERWRVPAILRYPAPGGPRSKRVWLTARDTVVDLGVATTPAWIEPNAGGSGYYRWSVPGTMLDSLAAARTTLTPRERIDLTANVTALLRGGQVPGDQYLQLMARLADDPSPEVTRGTVEVLNETRIPLTTPRAEDAMAAYLRTTFEPALRRFGMEPQPGEPVGVSLMRPALLRLLADGGHDARVVAYAESLGRDFRRDPGSIPPSLVETGIVVGAMRGDRAQFDDYRRRFETTRVPAERPIYLAGLGNFRDPALRAAALDYALSGPLRPQETLMIPSAMAVSGTAIGRGGSAIYPDDVTRWMMDHFADLSAKMPPNFSTRLMALGGGCSEDRLDKLTSYFKDPSHRIQGGEATLSRMTDAIRECSGLHERESARAERWLLAHTRPKSATAF
jgi:hypothetical protein